MTRSPLFYPLARGLDADSGGVAELQTDVMRFMAILSLCLVAIFALVQSIPLAPAVEEPPPPEPPPMAKPAPPEPRPVAAPAMPAPRAEPAVIPDPPPVVIEPEPRVASQPVPEPAPVQRLERTQRVEEAAPPAPEPAPPVQPEGFTLRFESDGALTRRVARNDVGLYAIAEEQSLRMSVNRGRMSFWPASQPNQFHEMDAATVPETVVDALRRSGRLPDATVKWGVTLPSAMSQQLDRILGDSRGGSIVIAADGDLLLEQTQ